MGSTSAPLFQGAPAGLETEDLRSSKISWSSGASAYVCVCEMFTRPSVPAKSLLPPFSTKTQFVFMPKNKVPVKLWSTCAQLEHKPVAFLVGASIFLQGRLITVGLWVTHMDLYSSVRHRQVLEPSPQPHSSFLTLVPWLWAAELCAQGPYTGETRRGFDKDLQERGGHRSIPCRWRPTVGSQGWGRERQTGLCALSTRLCREDPKIVVRRSSRLVSC